MLGLISEVNEMLQDVQGKKTVAIKRKILRSLGALVEQADIAINNVAPQVGSIVQRLQCIDRSARLWQRFKPWSAYQSSLRLLLKAGTNF